MKTSREAWAEMELLELGHVIVDDEDLAYELLSRVRKYRVHGRAEPIGEQFRVTIHPSEEERPALEVGFAAMKAAGKLAMRPSSVLEALP